MWWLYLFIVFIAILLNLRPGFAHQVPGATSFLLPQTYNLKGDGKQSFVIRQVPGDGGCLFHSVASWISYLSDHSHLEFDYRLRYLSSKLRMLAVDTLKKNCTLVLENDEVIDSVSLLKLVGEHYNITPLEYCRQMMDAKTWGGGPEIVALSNHFRCPIHVYQLCSTGIFSRRRWVLELCAKFGSPTFDHIRPPLHLLCADGRFPNIKPGQQKETGDHFLAVFPEQGAPLKGSFRLHGCPEFGEDPVFFERSGPEEVLRRVGGWLKGLRSLTLPLFGLNNVNTNANNKQSNEWLSSSVPQPIATYSNNHHHHHDHHHLRSEPALAIAEDEEEEQDHCPLRGGGTSNNQEKRGVYRGRRRSSAGSSSKCPPSSSSSLPVSHCPRLLSHSLEKSFANRQGGAWEEIAILSHLLNRQRQLFSEEDEEDQQP